MLFCSAHKSPHTLKPNLRRYLNAYTCKNHSYSQYTNYLHVCHIKAYFVIFLLFYPSNILIKQSVKIQTSHTHMAIDCQLVIDVTSKYLYPMHKPPPLFYPMLACRKGGVFAGFCGTCTCTCVRCDTYTSCTCAVYIYRVIGYLWVNDKGCGGQEDVKLDLSKYCFSVRPCLCSGGTLWISLCNMTSKSYQEW